MRPVLRDGRRAARLWSMGLATLGNGRRDGLLLRRRRAPLLLRGSTPLILLAPLLVLGWLLRRILAARVLACVWRWVALGWLLITLRGLLITLRGLLIALGRLLARIPLVRMALLMMAT
jgi:hypothetical protein